MDTNFVFETFRQQAVQTPKKIALNFGEEQMTYELLEKCSNNLSHHLRQNGVGPGSIVPILIHRSLERIIAIMGILKAGGAFLPLSVFDPPHRLMVQLDDCAAQLILTQHNLANRLPQEKNIMLLDKKSLSLISEDPLPLINKPTDLAYVIYTSGSTGKPKGVMIEHAALTNRLQWMQDTYQLKPHDIILHKTPFHFDVSIWEIFWWAYGGGSLAILPPGQESIPMAVTKAIAEFQVTLIHFVPSMLNVFLEYVDSTGKGPALSSLRRVFCSGEKLLGYHSSTFHQVLGSQGIQLTNLYGPTEATIDATHYDLPNQPLKDPIPIGKPIRGIQAFVMNEDIVKEYGQGELCLGGIGLARGYLNQPELTLARFIENVNSNTNRLYRTGDIAQILPDGNILFLGRVDEQVKIRGVRIELGEIESCICRFKEIKGCKVIVRNVNTSISLLIAYVVAHNHLPVEMDLKKKLSDVLPPMMIPNIIISVPEIPLLANGKVNISALPHPDLFQNEEKMIKNG